MKKNFLLFLMLLSIGQKGMAQSAVIKLQVPDPVLPLDMQFQTGSGTPVPVVTEQGLYLIRGEFLPDTIQFKATGFNPLRFYLQAGDSISLSLEPGAQLKELKTIVISERRTGITLDRNAVKAMQVIDAAELKKAACCDLSGCFETSLSVQPQVTNVLTRAKELRILGLSGIYNQVLIDGAPMIYGASLPYGISSYPGTSVEKIYIAKGAGSVIQGFDGLAGQINMVQQDGKDDDLLLLNLYANNFGEAQANVQSAIPAGRQSTHVVSLHATRPASFMDTDGDHLSDMPGIRRYHAAYKYTRVLPDSTARGFSTRSGVRYWYEDRFSGQAGAFPRSMPGHGDHGGSYQQRTSIRQAEAFTRSDFLFNKRNMITYHGSGFYNTQQGVYGALNYSIDQLFLNQQVQWEYSKKPITSVTGMTLRNIYASESVLLVNDSLGRMIRGPLGQHANLPGIYNEMGFHSRDARFTTLIGNRVDWRSEMDMRYTFRAILRWNVHETGTLRAGGGNGWRLAMPIQENPVLLATNRDLFVSDNLLPERGWNVGMSYVQQIPWEFSEGTLSVDYYYTAIRNQVFPDYDSDAFRAELFNQPGHVASHAFQVDYAAMIFDKVEIKASYLYLDVKRMGIPVARELPFVNKNRALFTISIPFLNEHFVFDGNVHYFGSQRLPDPLVTVGSEEWRTGRSPVYTIYNAQLTYTNRIWDFYAGCENISGFRQLRPIPGWQNPYSRLFDPTYAWGPTRAQEFYAGIRYRINRVNRM